MSPQQRLAVVTALNQLSLKFGDKFSNVRDIEKETAETILKAQKIIPSIVRSLPPNTCSMEHLKDLIEKYIIS